MDTDLRDRFIRLWHAYFPGAELPITFYYTAEPGPVEEAEPADGFRCFVAQLNDVRRGHAVCFGMSAIGCSGARRNTGFTDDFKPDFDHFLSCGLPGKCEGERYKSSPEVVRDIVARWPKHSAPARYIVFKRWDCLDADDHPDVAIFFAGPDVISGLFTLANFDESDPNVVITPMAAACATMVEYPYMERDADHPHAVLGLFDPSARPWVKPEILTFAVPMRRLLRMMDNASESFLTTQTWDRVRHRMGVSSDAGALPK
ncbi:MAG: DUF169 domain-containing protein [FCB group bacterium]|jgi:hypothetical protein|nr:DUF169 domain-containing protein [FCB group bacterium]